MLLRWQIINGFVALAAGTLSVVSCAGRESRAAHAEILAASSRFADALSRGDTVAIARSYTDDAEWYAPEVPAVKGGLQIARAWQSNVRLVGSRHRVDVAEVVETRDRAEEIGRFAVSARDGSVVAAAKYMVIWVREP